MLSDKKRKLQNFMAKTRKHSPGEAPRGKRFVKDKDEVRRQIDEGFEEWERRKMTAKKAEQPKEEAPVAAEQIDKEKEEEVPKEPAAKFVEEHSSEEGILPEAGLELADDMTKIGEGAETAKEKINPLGKVRRNTAKPFGRVRRFYEWSSDQIKERGVKEFSKDVWQTSGKYMARAAARWLWLAVGKATGIKFVVDMGLFVRSFGKKGDISKYFIEGNLAKEEKEHIDQAVIELLESRKEFDEREVQRLHYEKQKSLKKKTGVEYELEGRMYRVTDVEEEVEIDGKKVTINQVEDLGPAEGSSVRDKIHALETLLSNARFVEDRGITQAEKQKVQEIYTLTQSDIEKMSDIEQDEFIKQFYKGSKDISELTKEERLEALKYAVEARNREAQAGKERALTKIRYKEYRDKLAAILRAYRGRSKECEQQRNDKIAQLSDLYIKKKVTGMDLAQDALNFALVAGDVLAARAVMYGAVGILKRRAAARNQYKQEYIVADEEEFEDIKKEFDKAEDKQKFVEELEKLHSMSTQESAQVKSKYKEYVTKYHWQTIEDFLSRFKKENKKGKVVYTFQEKRSKSWYALKDTFLNASWETLRALAGQGKSEREREKGLGVRGAQQIEAFFKLLLGFGIATQGIEAAFGSGDEVRFVQEFQESWKKFTHTFEEKSVGGVLYQAGVENPLKTGLDALNRVIHPIDTTKRMWETLETRISGGEVQGEGGASKAQAEASIKAGPSSEIEEMKNIGTSRMYHDPDYSHTGKGDLVLAPEEQILLDKMDRAELTRGQLFQGYIVYRKGGIEGLKQFFHEQFGSDTGLSQLQKDHLADRFSEYFGERWSRGQEVPTTIGPSSGEVPGPVQGEIPVVSEHLEYQGGKRVWDEVANQLSKHSASSQAFSEMDQAEKTYAIDFFKDRIVANPEQYGLPKGVDPDHLTQTQLKTIHWDKLFNEYVSQPDRWAPELSVQAKENIIENNKLLSEYVKKTGNTLESETVDKLLSDIKKAGGLDEYLGSASVEAPSAGAISGRTGEGILTTMELPQGGSRSAVAIGETVFPLQEDVSVEAIQGKSGDIEKYIFIKGDQSIELTDTDFDSKFEYNGKELEADELARLLIKNDIADASLMKLETVSDVLRDDIVQLFEAKGDMHGEFQDIIQRYFGYSERDAGVVAYYFGGKDGVVDINDLPKGKGVDYSEWLKGKMAGFESVSYTKDAPAGYEWEPRRIYPKHGSFQGRELLVLVRKSDSAPYQFEYTNGKQTWGVVNKENMQELLKKPGE